MPKRNYWTQPKFAKRFPWLSTDGVATAGWGRSGEGGVDPNALMQLFRAGARSRGVDYIADEVVDDDTPG